MQWEACGFELIAEATCLPVDLFRFNQAIQPDFRHNRFLLAGVFSMPFAPGNRHAEQMKGF
jgi:hypothetical protein